MVKSMGDETEFVTEESIEDVSGINLRSEQAPNNERISESVGKFGIMKIIFSRKTAPHALSLSVFLGLMAFLSTDLIIILGFGFSIGYFLTALCMRFELARNLSIKGYQTALLLPMLLSFMISFLIWYFFNLTEFGERIRTVLSICLLLIFVIWQFAQAWWMRVPFKEFALKRMFKVSESPTSNFGRNINLVVPIFWSFIGLGIFTLLEDNGVNFTGTFKISWTVSMLLLGMSTFYLLKRINSENWSDYRISAFSGYFAIGYWIFLAYHVGVMLYSLERQPSFVFDLVFMLITIMLVIYSLSVQALRSEKRNQVAASKSGFFSIDRQNVIFYAISFTAAYGASNFFLVSGNNMFVDNIKSVSLISHFIVILSGIIVILLVNYTALVGRGLIDRGFVESIRTPKDN